MIIKETPISGCFIIQPKVISDDRGYFFESFNQQEFEKITGLKIKFVQDNQSMSSKGVLRGLHFQKEIHEQAKLVRVIKGKVLDVCVDLRRESETFGEHFSLVLDDLKKEQLFIPRGMAHGFLVMAHDTIFSYKCDNYYNKSSEGGIIYNDHDLGIDWGMPNNELILSKKDQNLPSFKQFLNEQN
jgi:dTDP-4-dehydrorhamnose 3,5-epimerase